VISVSDLAIGNVIMVLILVGYWGFAAWLRLRGGTPPPGTG
jgi:hypothetical protein